MKKNTFSFLLITALAVGLVLTQSCNKGKTNSTEQNQELITGNLHFDIPVIPTNGEYDSIVAFYYQINMDSFVKSFDQNYDTSSIQNVSLQSCQLLITNGTASDNFRNFHTVNVGITSGTNGRIYRMAAHNDIVDTAAYFLNIPTLYPANLASYMMADSIHYVIYGNMRRSTAQVLNCTAELKYNMTLLR